MSYKNYTFGHNPRRIRVSCQQGATRQILYGLGQYIQPLGPIGRTVQGEGSFFGSGALRQYTRLEQMLEDNTSGYLYIPGLFTIRAYLIKVTMLGEGKGDVVDYTCEFWEDLMTLSGLGDVKYG